MERFETIEKIPTWALCYIINGDPTGLSDEDIKMVWLHAEMASRDCFSTQPRWKRIILVLSCLWTTSRG